jgi:hypothetical protein
MNCQKFLDIKSKQTKITSITVAAMLITMTIAMGPLNLLQINSASAQNQANPNSSQMIQGTNPNPMSNTSNPDSSQINSPPGNGGTGNTSNTSGTISIISPIVNGFKSLMRVSLLDAITTAQNSLGGNSTTVAAFIHPSNGFIVYDTYVLDANNNIHKIVVDPANGRILISEPLSLMELMMMVHGGGMGIGSGMDKGMMMGPGMGIGSGMDKGMMMGPGMGIGSGMDKGMMMHHGGGMGQGW